MMVAGTFNLPLRFRSSGIVASIHHLLLLLLLLLLSVFLLFILPKNPSTCTALLLLRTTTLTRQQQHRCFRRPNRQQRGEKTATATTDLSGRQRRLSSLSSYQSSSTSEILSTSAPATPFSFKYTAEVVGANGRIGSFWLYRHFLNNDDDDDDDDNNNIIDTTGTITANKHSNHKSDTKDEDQDQKTNTAVIACPRGSSPGCLTPIGTPIYVATPSDTYLQIYNETIPSRKNDLVFVGNAGIPIPREFRSCTILVPHFAVLHNNTIANANANASNNKDDKDNDDYDASKIIVNTDPLKSPPTYIYGKHSTIASKVLETNGIKTEIVNSFEEIQALSGRKLVWASCLWLLCHDDIDDDDDDACSNDDNDDACDKGAVTKRSQALTVEQVHELRQDGLDRLVDDLLPSLQHLLSSDDENNNDNNEQIRKILNKKGIDEYLKAYSSSIPNAVPSKDLAIKEYTERNGVWSSYSNSKEGEGQKVHLKLLRRQGIDV